MKEVILPPTIRTCTLEEVPKEPNLIKKIKARVDAKIIEGYTFKINDSDDFQYKFFAEINIDNDRLWILLETFLLQMPDEVACIYNHIDNDPTYGLYLDKFEILSTLEKYKIEIAEDGFIELGIIFHTESFLEEAFIKKGKYIQYWGMDEERFRTTMNDFSLYQIDDLNFIDEYPMTTTWLKGSKPEVLETDQLLNELNKAFLDEL